MQTPIQQWRALIAKGQLQHDPAQEQAAQMLSLLSGRLQNWKPGKKKPLFGKMDPAPVGLYLYGDVGRGKSMLMDMFYQSAPTDRKVRVHFHDFMQKVHGQIANWRQLPLADKKKHPHYVRGCGDDPIAPVAKGICQGADLLCFDEFQVSDIADAMLLGRLFEKIFSAGVIVVLTSNRAPDDLYRDGLNRQRFLPFIARVKGQLDVLDLQGARDYRRGQVSSKSLYFTPLNTAADQGMDALWCDLLAGEAQIARDIQVQGRVLSVARSIGGAARLGFGPLCDTALGTADYLELAAQFHTVFLEHVPKMGPDQRNAAKRFVLLIDALYEARVKLVISAAGEPDQLYDVGDGSFEFARCASRLAEMRSDAWVDAVHQGRGLVV